MNVVKAGKLMDRLVFSLDTHVEDFPSCCGLVRNMSESVVRIQFIERDQTRD